MCLVREIVILCLLFGSIDCQTSSDEKTSLTSDDSNDHTSTSTTETSESITTQISTKDTIYTGEPPKEKEKSTTKESSTPEVDASTLPNTSTKLIETTTEVTVKPPACTSKPCRNNATCIDDSTDPELYSCSCTKGFTGSRCQVADKCIVNNDGSVCHKGACAYESGALSRACKCFYGNFWDDEKKECAEKRPPCFPNPCLNHGICTEHGDNFTCDCSSGFEGNNCNIVNECGENDCESGECITKGHLKYCKCNKNFYWDKNTKACEAVQPPCIPNPCKNSGKCEPLSGVDFNCTCPYNFMGKTCEVQDFCAVPEGEPEVCRNGECVESENSRKCHCKKGYFLNEDINDCEVINPPCHPNPCKNDGICMSLSSDTYNCTCSDGFIGKSCSDLDHCVLDGGNAFCGEASCKNDLNLATFYCACESGQYFDYSSRTCKKIDFCPLMKCNDNELCEDSNCTCKENYEWNNSSKKCEANFCSSSPCPTEDLVCTEGNGKQDYDCACKKGFSFNGINCKNGSTCRFPKLNSCEQQCNVLEEGYSCSCLDDFKLKDNKTCDYVGNSTCSNMTCSIGQCVAMETEKCVCPPGFKEVEGQCKDLCSIGELPDGFCPGNKCETTSTGFRCKCEGKYTFSSDEITCKVRRMCQISEEGWKACAARNAICKDEWSSFKGYKCHCGSGLVENEDGTCQEVCSIEENQKICSMFGAKCDVDGNGNMICKCPPYFQPFEEGKVCNKPARYSYIISLPLSPTVYERTQNNPVKLRRQANAESTVDYHRVQNDVKRVVEALMPGLLHTNVLSYKKYNNYILCKVEMQFLTVEKDALKRFSLTDLCHKRTESQSSCLISPSLVLQKDYIKDIVTVQKTNPCDFDIKDALCESETYCSSSVDDMSFNCTCNSGFAVRNKIYPFGTTQSFIESCRDIDECALINPCPPNMKCQNTFGSYECSCKPGFQVDKDSSSEKCVELCSPNPCVHGKCKEIEDHAFQCRCDVGYSGSTCDLQDEHFKRARTNTIIVGAVLGGALLVTIILSYAFISRLKKRKYIDDPNHMLYGTEMSERRTADSGVINNAYRRD